MSIRETFNKNADEYDLTRRILIPCFDSFYGTAVELIPFDKNSSFKVLDLGAGTGLFSAIVAEHFSSAEFTLCDVSDKMLQQAEKRFTNNPVKVKYIVKDYSRESIEGNYDLIISALSIHHLCHSEKEILFAKLYRQLKNNGVFINADQVLGESEYIEETYRQAWMRHVKEKGATDEMLTAALERMQEDKMSTLNDQLHWLKKAGFSDVNCWYKNFNFVVYSGIKNDNELTNC